MLYHYTSLNTLVSVLTRYKGEKDKGLTLWASSLYSMNDPNEMYHGVKFLMNVIPALENMFVDRPSGKSGLKDAIKEYLGTDDENLLMHKLDKYLIEVGLYPFSLSFSEAEDTLPMWKMYGDNGNGVALLFDNDLLKEEFKNSIYAGLVSYGYNESDPKLIKLIIDKVLDSFDKQENNSKEKVIQEKMLSAAGLIAFVCPFLKDESYQYEKENRMAFISQKHSDTRYRVRGNSIVPYIEVSIPVRYLKGVVIGPRLPEYETRRSLQHLLLSCDVDIDKVEIIKSNIQYRE